MTADRAALLRFGALVSSDAPPVAEALALAARHLGHPTTPAACLAEIDALAVAVGGALGAQPRLDEVAIALRTTFGFRGNRADYGDPRNSLLPEVLASRSGIPLTLAVVVVEVSSRLGVDASIVGMPGHVLVGDGQHPARWIDAFEPNGWLGVDGAEAIFRGIHGPGPRFDRRLLAPTPPRLVLARATENLIASHRARGRGWGTLRSLELRAQIPGFGETPSARAQLAEAYAGVGRWPEAVQELEAVAGLLQGERRAAVLQQISRLRANAN